MVNIVQGLEQDTLNALGGAVVGALLVMAWDLLKYRRELKRRDKAGLGALMQNLSDNQAACADNLGALRSEVENLKRNKSLVGPIVLLDDSVWQLLKLQLPRKIADDQHLLRGASFIYRQISMINATISSREAYRLANTATSNFKSHLSKYDQTLIGNLESLWQALVEYESELLARNSIGHYLGTLVKDILGIHNKR